MILVFWMLNVNQTFHSFFSSTFNKKFFSSSSLSAIRVVSSAYLRLLIFLQAILIPAWASSSLVFCMTYSAYKLNKQGDNIWLWRTPFPILNQSIVPCLTLTIASWNAYRFLRRQVRWSGIPIAFRIFQCMPSSNSSPLMDRPMQVNLWGLKGEREEHMLGRLHLTREMDHQVVHRTSTTSNSIPLSILGPHCLPLGGN